MWEAITEGIREAFLWILSLFVDLAAALWALVLALVPEDLEPGLGVAADYVVMANYWVPLDFAFMLFSTWFGIATFMASFRFMKQFVPSISN